MTALSQSLHFISLITEIDSMAQVSSIRMKHRKYTKNAGRKNLLFSSEIEADSPRSCWKPYSDYLDCKEGVKKQRNKCEAWFNLAISVM